MQRYRIPDIRLFWTEDTGFWSQFEGAKPEQDIIYTVKLIDLIIMYLNCWEVIF